MRLNKFAVMCNFLKLLLSILLFFCENNRIFLPCSAIPSFFSGWFTLQSNNPAFKCNSADVGRTYHDVVIEARIHKFTNEHDSTYKGGHCDFLVFNQCDLRLRGLINTDHPLENFPNDNAGFVEMIHEWHGNDIKPDNTKYGPDHERHAWSICKPVSMLSIATVHIAIDDVDSATKSDIVNHFNCYWSPKHVGNRRRESKWETINCCTAFKREMRSTVRQELLIDIRAYKADGGSDQQCPADGRF